MRFYTEIPEELPTTPANLPALLQNAFDQATVQVEIAPDGLLDTQGGWRLVSEGDGISSSLPTKTTPSLRLLWQPPADHLLQSAKLCGALQSPRFWWTQSEFSSHHDNPLLVEPASGGKPSDTKYFLYPGERTNPDRPLSIQLDRSDIAAPASDLLTLQNPLIFPEQE